MEIDGILDKALSPTRLPATVSSGEIAPYLVLRNHIPIYTNSTLLPENSALEFISLGDDADSDDCRTPTPPPPPPLKRSKLAVSLTNDESTTSRETDWFRANCRFKSPMLQLHKEILDFCDFLSPTAEEQVSRNTAVETVSDVIKCIWPHCRVEVFGSFKTGLFLPSSDVDMVIFESHVVTPQRGLKALKSALSRRGVATKMQVLGKARVPIIKFVEKRSGIAFDISFDMENGPKSADYVQDAISKWPPLRPLCLILKVFLRQRKFNEVYSGGIGSYALLVMLIAMLRNSLVINSFAEDNLGVLLLNTSDVGISCNEGSTFFSKSSKGFLYSSKKLLISIQDPQEPEKDLGRNSRKYSEIKHSFVTAYSTLTNTKLIMSLCPSRSILGTIIGPGDGLLERKGGLNGDLTFTGILPGAGEPLQEDFDEHSGLFCNGNLDGDSHDEEELVVDEKDDTAVGDDGVAKKSKKMIKVKKMVKVKKIRKVIVIKERKRSSAVVES